MGQRFVHASQWIHLFLSIFMRRAGSVRKWPILYPVIIKGAIQQAV